MDGPMSKSIVHMKVFHPWTPPTIRRGVVPLETHTPCLQVGKGPEKHEEMTAEEDIGFPPCSFLTMLCIHCSSHDFFNFSL